MITNERGSIIQLTINDNYLHIANVWEWIWLTFGFGVCIGAKKIKRKDVESKLAWKDRVKHVN